MGVKRLEEAERKANEAVAAFAENQSDEARLRLSETADELEAAAREEWATGYDEETVAFMVCAAAVVVSLGETAFEAVADKADGFNATVDALETFLGHPAPESRLAASRSALKLLLKHGVDVRARLAESDTATDMEKVVVLAWLDKNGGDRNG